MWNKLRQAEWVKWNPNIDVVVALLTLVWQTAAFYTLNHTSSLIFTIFGFAVLTNLVVNVVLPTYWVVGYRKQPLSELGITTRGWLLSLLLSLLMAGLGLRRLWPFLMEKNEVVVLLLYNAVILWEPFFLYGWLQLCLERAFGVLPGILLAGLGLATYHIGSYPQQMVLGLIVVGVAYGALFRVTRNLLVLWPLAWAVSGALGMAQGESPSFNWKAIPIYVVLLAIQFGFIAYMGRRQARADAGSEAK